MMGSAWEATLQLTDKREEACHKTRQAHTLTHPPQQLLLPHPPIKALFIGSPLLLANPPNSPAKLTAPSSVENESRSHYNRAGQIPLALSEIERREKRAGGSGVCPYQRKRESSADVTNPQSRIEQTHKVKANLKETRNTHTHSFIY